MRGGADWRMGLAVEMVPSGMSWRNMWEGEKMHQEGSPEVPGMRAQAGT